MRFLRTVISFYVLTSLFFINMSFAQAFDPAQFASIQKENSAALKKCTWKQRLELSMKGETKKVTLNMMRYDASGKQQKTLLNEQPKAEPQQPPSGRGSRLKSKVVEKKTEEFKQMMEDLAALATSYSQIPPDQLKAAAAQSEKIPGSGNLQGTIGIRMSNVLQDKDSLTLWIDTATLLFRKVEINSMYDKNPVKVTANYATMSRGPNYMSQAVLSYPEKQLLVKIENFDYQMNP